MKNLLAFLVLLIAYNLQAQQVDFHEGDLASALEKAAAENKPVLIDAYTDWCGPCKMLDEEVFKDAAASAYINENFVPYKLDMEKGEGPWVAMKFRVKSYPTTLFLSSEGKLMSVQKGYPGTELYLDWCKAVINGETKTYEQLDAHNLKPDFPNFYKHSFTSDQWERERATAEGVNAYLKTQEDLYSEVNWSVISALAYTGHDYLSWAVENAEELKGSYPESEVDELVKRFVYLKVGSLKGEEPIEEVEARIVEVLDSVLPEANEDLSEDIFTQLYFQRKEYARLLNYIYKVSEEEPNPGFINSICWGIYKESADPELVKRAIKEMHKTIEKERHPYYIDTLAHLYFKNGDRKQAHKYATEALEKAKKQNLLTKETEELLKSLEG